MFPPDLADVMQMSARFRKVICRSQAKPKTPTESLLAWAFSTPKERPMFGIPNMLRRRWFEMPIWQGRASRDSAAKPARSPN
jgi:hypothetical protein